MIGNKTRSKTGFSHRVPKNQNYKTNSDKSFEWKQLGLSGARQNSNP